MGMDFFIANLGLRHGSFCKTSRSYLNFFNGFKTYFVLWTDDSEDGRQKEDGMQQPKDDDEKHDLEERLEDVGSGGGEDDNA